MEASAPLSANALEVNLRLLLRPQMDECVRARRMVGAVAECLRFPHRSQIELELAVGELLAMAVEQVTPLEPEPLRLTLRGASGRLSVTLSWLGKLAPDFTSSASPLASAHENRNHVITNSVDSWRSYIRSGRQFVTLEKCATLAALEARQH